MTKTLNPTSEDTRVYEIAVLLPGSASDKERSDTIKSIDAVLQEKNIAVLHKDEWKRMGLAYKIKGETHGYYIILYIEGKPDVIKDVDHALTIERGVLRHLVVKLPENYPVTDWAEHFAAWKNQAKAEIEERKQQKEEALKKKIVQRASKKTAPAKSTPEKSEKMEEEQIQEKISELISDDDLNL